MGIMPPPSEVMFEHSGIASSVFSAPDSRLQTANSIKTGDEGISPATIGIAILQITSGYYQVEKCLTF